MFETDSQRLEHDAELLEYIVSLGMYTGLDIIYGDIKHIAEEDSKEVKNCGDRKATDSAEKGRLAINMSRRRDCEVDSACITKI